MVNVAFTLWTEPKRVICVDGAVLTGSDRKGISMTELFERYKEYRQVGFGPLIALRFAWLVGKSNGRLLPIRTHRPPLTRGG
jgi:hypothetical protein